MDSRRAKYIITYDESRPKTPHKLEIRAWYAGKKIRRWKKSQGEAELAAQKIIAQIQSHGVQSLNSEAITVAEATKRFRPRADGKSKSHAEKVRQICELLDARFGDSRLGHITAPILDELINSVASTSSTRAVYFRYLRMFFRWAWRFDLISKSPVLALDCPPTRPKSNILTPQQLRDVLEDDGVEIWLRRAVLSSACGGLRTAEVARMDLTDFDTKAKQAHVRPGVQKDSGGFFERIVEFTPPMIKRIKWYEEKGPLLPCSERMYHKHRKALAERMHEKHPARWNGKWPDNSLRHSFATYYLAKCKNPSITAFQMGHTSPSMVQRVYAVPAKRADWKAWWAV